MQFNTPEISSESRITTAVLTGSISFHARFAAVFLGLLFVAAPSWAASGASQDEIAQQLRDDYQIIVAPSAAWRATDLGAIRDGAAAMPRAFFNALDAPLRIERRPQKCLFAQGRYDEACPTFSEDERTFYMYEPAAVSPKILARVMPGLNPAQRRALFYQRAIVHLVVAKLDQKMAWSQAPRWQKINGWEDDDDPLNQDWWGYSRPIGRRSAHLNLVTFAEEYFARPESLRPTLTPDKSVACRMMTASRVFSNFVHTLAPDWRSPAPGGPDVANLSSATISYATGGFAAPQTGCPAFEQWFDRQNIKGMDLVFIGARSDTAESIYGHIILNARYGSGAQYFRAGDQPIFQFGAVTASKVNTAEYIFSGLFGGFSSVLEYNTWRVADRLFARYEGRNLRRYSLNLTPPQLLHVMQRIWETQRHIRYTYYFLDENCASLLVNLLAPALDVPIASVPSFIVMPTDVLDTLARTPNGQGEPLLNSSHARWASSEARALDAVERRRQILDSLADHARSTDPKESDVPSKMLLKMRQIHPHLEEKSPQKRHQAYLLLAAQLSQYIAQHPPADTPSEAAKAWHQRLIKYFYLSTVVERYFVEHARFMRRESMLAADDSAPDYSAEDELDEFRRIYQIPTLKERLIARNQFSKKKARLLAPPTAELSTPRANQMWAEERRVQATYQASLDGLSAAVDALGSQWSGTDFIEEMKVTKTRAETRFNARSIGPSGRFALGPRVALRAPNPLDDIGAPRTRVGLSAAFIRDELGEARLRGYTPGIESKIFDLDLSLEPTADWAESIEAQAIIFRYLNLSRKQGPFIESWTDRFGWGVDVQIRHDGPRGLHFGGDASTGYLYPVWMSARGVNHLVLGVFGALRSDLGDVTSRAMIGGRVFVRAQAHLYGNYANLMQLKLQTHQFIALDNTWQFDASGELNTRHALGSVEQYPMWVEPFVELEYTSRAYQAQAQRISDLTAGLRVEVSF